MTDRFNAGFINAAYVSTKVPPAPTNAVANKLNQGAEITHSGSYSPYATVTSYRATSTPGNFTGTAAGGTITVNGLTNGVSYTFQVTAINAFGESSGSNVTNAVVPSELGQRLYTAGSFTFIVPTGITSVSVVCVGGGGASGASTFVSGAGGSGIVILRYPSYQAAAKATTGNPQTYVTGPWRVYVFIASGTITF